MGKINGMAPVPNAISFPMRKEIKDKGQLGV